MILLVHAHMCTSPQVWIGAFSSELGKDVILESQMTPARLEILYKSTLNGKPLAKEIVNHLFTDDVGSVFELKKDSLRLTFFEDIELCFKERIVSKVIVCLSFFVKKTKKTDPKEIKHAVALRDLYLRAKQNNSLQIKDCK